MPPHRAAKNAKFGDSPSVVTFEGWTGLGQDVGYSSPIPTKGGTDDEVLGYAASA